MDNQHRKISGYRELSQKEIDYINSIKKKEQEVLKLVNSLSLEDFPDLRWLNIAKTDIEKGFMSLVRSVAKPNTPVQDGA